MWDIRNQTEFTFASAFVRNRKGRETWLVAVRATFDIKGDKTTLAEKQLPVSQLPAFESDDPNSPLLVDNDLVLEKAGTDILVFGKVTSPKKVPFVAASLRAPGVEKTLHIYGPRRWEKGPKAGAPAGLESVELSYRHALGGDDNPSVPPPTVGEPAPQIESPSAPLSDGIKKAKPAGFGPIASHWPSRAKWAGTFDEAWMKNQRPLLPLDTSPKFFNCAPEDQQTKGFLVGGEQFTLSGFGPELLRFKLPVIKLYFTTTFEQYPSEGHPYELHTVSLFPDKSQVALTWHTRLDCQGRDQILEATLIQRLKS